MLRKRITKRQEIYIIYCLSNSITGLGGKLKSLIYNIYNSQNDDAKIKILTGHVIFG